MAARLRDLTEASGEAVAWIVREITHICRDMKKRAPGSEGEREAAAYMAGVLRDECGCGHVLTEPFTVRPGGFYGYFVISAILGLLTIGCYFIRPWLTLVFAIPGLVLFLLHFVLYRQVLDPFFPGRESVNVTATRPPSGEVRARIFLNGHTDAAREFPLNYYCGGIVFEIPGAASFFGSLFYTALSVTALSGAGAWTRTAALWGLLFVPAFILTAFTNHPTRVVPGANDNLSACYMGIALLREMERRGVVPEHTEIGVILTGSEEVGLRGAKAWVKAHRDDYRDVPTYIVSFDTIHDPRRLMVNRRDLNSVVRSDETLGEMFLEAAKTAGVPCGTGVVPLLGGATDSAAFTQGGFASIGVTGLSHVLKDYYHTRRDDCDNLNGEGLGNCWRAMVMLADLIENGQKTS